MSIGAPSNLGTLLVQRLDAALGTTLGQQANIVSGAGPQAVPQPGSPENPSPLQNPTQRHPREAVDQAGAEGQRRAAVGKAVREMQLDNLLGRTSTSHGTTQSAPTTLGYAARIILALLQEFPQGNQTIQGRAPLLSQPGQPGPGASTPAGNAPGTPGAVAGAMQSSGPVAQASGTAPLWAQLATTLHQPGALAARFAQALSQSIQGSGLFYESHLAQLAAGKTSPQAVRQEPQGQLSHTAPAAGASGSAALTGQPTTLTALVQQAQAAATPTTLDPGTPAPNTASHGAGSSVATGLPPGGHAPGTVQAPIPGIDPQAQFLVRQQLDVLANQGFLWQGEAWPGTPMEWEVRRRQPDDGQTPEVAQEHWATRLNLQLPALGEVQVRLSLSGDQLVMRLTAPESADRLSQAIEPLRARLLAQGLQASQLSVLDHDPEGSGDDSTPAPPSDTPHHDAAPR